MAYHFTITNHVTTAISELEIDDPQLDRADVSIDCADSSLAPGASTECTATGYRISDSDQAAGTVHNIATATGTTPQGGPVSSPPASTDPPVTAPAPAITLTKEVADADHNDQAEVGEVLHYTFTVTNSGNVVLDAVVIDDPMLTAAGVEPVCPTDALEPGKSLTCTADYTVTEDDTDTDEITNYAVAQAKTTDDGSIESDPATATIETDRPSPSPTPGSPGLSSPGSEQSRSEQPWSEQPWSEQPWSEQSRSE